mmetsp:Transcript_144950/g.351965  ORF Transcript_144950/g.351965 Transcript_144950/m.351965 type:complete len:327 (-) Transcript_144950:33-1013(-)
MGYGRAGGPGTAGTVCCGLIFFIVSLFLFAFSFDTLSATEMGLMYDANLCRLDTSVVYNAERNQGGRWWTGLGVNFITFPKEVQVVKFNTETDADMPSIQSKTQDGADVDMGISFQFRLLRDADNLSKLYLKFGVDEFGEPDYKRFVHRYARQVTRDVLSEYKVTELWEKRREVGTQLEAVLSTELTKRHCELIGFQLLNLDVPADLKEAIVTTTVAFQGIEKAEFELAQEEVQARTRRLVAEQAATITVLNANGTAAAFLLDTEAEALSLAITTRAEVDAYKHVAQELSFGSDMLLDYIWVDNMLATDVGQMYLSVDQPAVTKAA